MLVDDTEPDYKGRRLSEWIKWTEDQAIDRTPSAEARQADVQYGMS